MRTFRVVISGNEYEVAIEEIGASGDQAAPASAPTARSASSPAAAAPAAAAPAAAAAKEEAGGVITAQMPGTIVDIQVSPGEQVTRGQTLLILEAMKMANEVVAPHDGVVQEIKVAGGASVNAGDALVILG